MAANTTVNIPTAPAVAAADEEARLTERAQAGDREAFGALYAHYEGTVHDVVAGLLKDCASDVDDVASLVFLRALEQIRTYEHHGRPFVAWLNQITRWRVAEHRQQLRRRQEEGLAETDTLQAEALVEPGLGPEDVTVLRWELMALFNSLGARRRLALALRVWAGWPNEEIAQVLHISLHAADALISEARKAARQAALGQRPLTDRSACECGCGRPIGPRLRRFATPDCMWAARNRRRAERRRLRLTGRSAIPAREVAA